jgi:hypothetical protein
MISEDTFHRIYVENGISYFLRTLKGVDFDTKLSYLILYLTVRLCFS